MFRVGEKVACLISFSGKAQYGCSNYQVPHPKKGKIYIISHIEVAHNKYWVGVVGFPAGLYSALRFRKIDYDFVEEIIKQVKEEPITI